MRRFLRIRAAADIALAGSMLFLPWWFSLALALVFFFFFKSYYELILAGLFLDMLFAPPREESLISVRLFCTTLACLCFIAGRMVKKRMRIENMIR